MWQFDARSIACSLRCSFSHRNYQLLESRLERWWHSSSTTPFKTVPKIAGHCQRCQEATWATLLFYFACCIDIQYLQQVVIWGLWGAHFPKVKPTNNLQCKCWCQMIYIYIILSLSRFSLSCISTHRYIHRRVADRQPPDSWKVGGHQMTLLNMSTKEKPAKQASSDSTSKYLLGRQLPEHTCGKFGESLCSVCKAPEKGCGGFLKCNTVII